jgi:hypothetical protein
LKLQSRIAFPKARNCATLIAMMRLQQGFAPGEMGFRAKFAQQQSEPLMSALGQKQTSAHVHVMSALPPKADIGTGPYQLRRTNFGSFVIFAAIRRASSLVSSLAVGVSNPE